MIKLYRKRLTYKSAYSGHLRWWERLFLTIFGYHGKDHR